MDAGIPLRARDGLVGSGGTVITVIFRFIVERLRVVRRPQGRNLWYKDVISKKIQKARNSPTNLAFTTPDDH